MKRRALVCGAGGFIGGHLVNALVRDGAIVRAVDIKAQRDWYQVNRDGVQNLCMDLTRPKNCEEAVRGMDDVYQLAADMGGMGFIEKYRVECMRSVLINVHMLEAAYRAGVDRFFFSSSACVYNTDLQRGTQDVQLKESDAYPAKAERGYGWEKLYSEMLCQEYWAERGLKTFIARFHNVYGPFGAWQGGREKAPAALCRKVIEAKTRAVELARGMTAENVVLPRVGVSVWGTGEQKRSFTYIDDCVSGIRRIVDEPQLVAKPINLGSDEAVSVNELLAVVSEIAGYRPEFVYDLSSPVGVGSRNSDNTLIRRRLNWAPDIPLRFGLEMTYKWIEQEFKRPPHA